MAKLRETDRLDLACLTALALLRSAVAAACAANRDDDEALAVADAATALFVTYAEELFERCDEQMLSPVPFVNLHSEFGFFATYSVRCARTIELLGLLALWQQQADGYDARAVTSWLLRFLAEQPGAAHPVSDRYAVSLIPAAIVAAQHDRQLVAAWLRAAVVWLADRYDGELLGLAAHDADAETEVAYMLSALSHIELPRRRQSYLATVLLDLISALEFGELYADARHELLAVDAHPELLHVPDTAEQFLRDGGEIEQEIDPPYSEQWLPQDGWFTAPHHAQAAPRWLERIGRPWMALACASVLRDRHDVGLIRRAVIGSDGPPKV